MSILENVKERVTTAAKSAVKASSDLIEVSKLNMSISGQKDKMKSLMLEMGELVYQSYKEGKPVEAELSVKCEAIESCEKSVDELRAKILEVKHLKKCATCDAEVDEEYSFCPKCGKKFE